LLLDSYIDARLFLPIYGLYEVSRGFYFKRSKQMS
jgi:hypothetical protein